MRLVRDGDDNIQKPMFTRAYFHALQIRIFSLTGSSSLPTFSGLASNKLDGDLRTECVLRMRLRRGIYVPFFTHKEEHRAGGRTQIE